jgi:micrococcal nuclease
VVVVLKRTSALSAFTISFFLILTLCQAADPLTVTRVIDGDTLKLSNGEKIRLIGVDTPELHHPSKPVQYFAEEAYQFVKKLIEGQEVRLEYDWEKKDKYGRTLAYVYRSSDGLFLNAEIVKQGYGFAYTRFPFKKLDEFRKLEQEAREKQLGLWKVTVGDDEIKGLIAEYQSLTEDQRKSTRDYIAKLKLTDQMRRKENETTAPVSR